MPENYTFYWDEIEINREFLIKILDQICEKYDLTNEEIQSFDYMEDYKAISEFSF